MKPADRSPLQASITRRTILKKAAYMTPVLFTLPAVPAFAAAGSKKPKPRKHEEMELLFFNGRAPAPLPAPTPRHHEEEDR